MIWVCILVIGTVPLSIWHTNMVVERISMCHWVFMSWLLSVVSSELHSSDRIRWQGKKDQWLSLNLGPTLYHGVSATRAIDPSRSHPVTVLKGDWGRRISTGIDGLRDWNSAIEHRYRVWAQSLVPFPLLPYPVWDVEFTTYYMNIHAWNFMQNMYTCVKSMQPQSVNCMIEFRSPWPW